MGRRRTRRDGRATACNNRNNLAFANTNGNARKSPQILRSGCEILLDCAAGITNYFRFSSGRKPRTFTAGMVEDSAVGIQIPIEEMFE